MDACIRLIVGRAPRSLDCGRATRSSTGRLGGGVREVRTGIPHALVRDSCWFTGNGGADLTTPGEAIDRPHASVTGARTSPTVVGTRRLLPGCILIAVSAARAALPAAPPAPLAKS